MSRIRSDSAPVRRLAAVLALVLLAAAAMPAAAQQEAQLLDVLSSEINVSRDAASLRLELADGRTLQVAIRDGGAYVDGGRIGDAPRGGPLDQAWSSC
jgi:regulator of sirC expression with transglutaminase-like and TPR domain